MPDTMGIEDFMTVLTTIVSASTGPKVLDSLVEQWGSTRFIHRVEESRYFQSRSGATACVGGV